MNKIWKGKSWKNNLGYLVIWKDGRQIYEHRLILEAKLGRLLEPFPREVVHHINDDRKDNRPENLLNLSQSEHMELHKIKNFIKTLPVLRLANQPS